MGLVKMDYYGRSGNMREFENGGIRFETDAVFFIQEIQARLWGSNFFAGLGYSLVDTANRFSRHAEELTLDRPGLEFDRRSASFNALLSYDSRDNIFTPSTGLASEIKAMFFDDAWGSDDVFQNYLASFLYYNPLPDNLVLGLRGDANPIDGNAPFYAYRVR